MEHEQRRYTHVYLILNMCTLFFAVPFPCGICDGPDKYRTPGTHDGWEFSETQIEENHVTLRTKYAGVLTVPKGHTFHSNQSFLQRRKTNIGALRNGLSRNLIMFFLSFVSLKMMM